MKNPVLRTSLAVAVLAASFVWTACCEDREDNGEGAHTVHWGYKGDHGPAYWGELKNDFATCKTGESQSPIDVRGPFSEASRKISFHYRASHGTIVDNGHTVQFTPNDGGYMELNGVKYRLLQFHFHTPGEHTINGESFPMEMHLVHKSDAGELAVVGILYKKGAANSSLQKVWKEFPEEEDKTLAVPDAVSAEEFLPADSSFYAYTGSLTTPPCSEGVKWQIMIVPIEASGEQIARFSKNHPNSNRPVQPLHGRKIEKK